MVELMKKCTRFFALCFVALSLISCAELFQGKIPMQTRPSNSLLDLFLQKSEITLLEKPSQIFVSQGRHATKIEISWSGVENAISYRLEKAVISPVNGVYRNPEETDFSVLEENVFTTSYVDTILSTAETVSDCYNNRYYYRVSAENSRLGLESSEFLLSEYGSLFAPPSFVTADLGTSTDFVTVSWDFVPNATSYDIYRTQNENGLGAEKIASVLGNRNSYKNTMGDSEQGKEFYYYVLAKNSIGNEAAKSALVMGYALVAGAPDQVKNVIITEGRGETLDSVSLSWDAVTAISEVTYTIYRTTSEDSSLTLLSSTTATSYTDKKALKPNIYYYYQIQASVLDAETGEKLKGKISESGKDSLTPAEAFVLSTPSSVSIEKTTDSEKIMWLPALGNDEEKAKWVYEIYGDSSANGEFATLLQSCEASSLSLDANGYYSVDLQETASFYGMRTYNPECDVRSSLSAIVAPAPLAARNAVATQAAKLSDAEMISNESGVYPVKITWEKPIDDNPSGYYIFRSTKADSGFKKITDDLIAATEFVDVNDTAKPGRYYYYRILAVNSLGQGINYSNTAIGYGALTYEQYMREFNKTMMSSQDKLTLMHKSGTTDKLGTETIQGAISGTLYYNASIEGLGGRVIMEYKNYADFYVDGDKDADGKNDLYFLISGNTNTSAEMSQDGTMDGTVTCVGMYPGKVYYDNIEIKSGAAGGGTYGIEPVGFARKEISWTVGEK